MGVILNSRKKRSQRNILIFTIVVFILPVVAILCGLSYIQIIGKNVYKQKAIAQWTRDQVLPSIRGDILDRNYKKLAISSPAYEFYVRPDLVKDKEGLALLLSKKLFLNKSDVLEKLNSKKDTVLIKKKVDVDSVGNLVKEIDEGKHVGLLYYDDTKRYYTQSNFASYILGFTDIDNQGQEGIEQKFESVLNGLPGRDIKLTDARGIQLPGSEGRYVAAQDGSSLVLTLDETIQHYIEKSAVKALEINKAKRVTVLAMDPKTGDILGMTSKPDFDSNDPRKIPSEYTASQWSKLSSTEQVNSYYRIWRNPAVADAYEPGSPFKLFTAAAALEEKSVKPNDKFYDKGYIEVYDRIMKCWRYPDPHGVETFKEAIGNSCNPVVVEVALNLGEVKFLKYVKAFGFGQYTGVQLPGETAGSLRELNQIGPVELANMSFGQGINVTPLQLLTAVCAIGNNGYLMEPRIVKRILNPDGTSKTTLSPKVVRQVISKETANTLLDFMEYTATYATGKEGYIPGYRIAAKTGTAQKAVGGVYKEGLYVASYVAMAPANNPKIALLTIIDEPNGNSIFGGIIAGRATKEMLTDILRYLNVEPQYTVKELEALKKK